MCIVFFHCYECGHNTSYFTCTAVRTYVVCYRVTPWTIKYTSRCLLCSDRDPVRIESRFALLSFVLKTVQQALSRQSQAISNGHMYSYELPWSNTSSYSDTCNRDSNKRPLNRLDAGPGLLEEDCMALMNATATGHRVLNRSNSKAG